MKEVYIVAATRTPIGAFGGALSSISATQIKVTSKRISSIDLADGSKVRFFATTNRTDLVGDKRLDRITVEKDGVVFKEFAFDYENIQSNESPESRVYSYRKPDYAISYGAGNAQFQGLLIPVSENMSSTQTGAYLEIDAGVKNRMYLKSITEKGQALPILPPYTFEYYNQQDLSFRTSVNQDVYGYTKTPGVPSSQLPPLDFVFDEKALYEESGVAGDPDDPHLVLEDDDPIEPITSTPAAAASSAS